MFSSTAFFHNNSPKSAAPWPLPSADTKQKPSEAKNPRHFKRLDSLEGSCSTYKVDAAKVDEKIGPTPAKEMRWFDQLNQYGGRRHMPQRWHGQRRQNFQYNMPARYPAVAQYQMPYNLTKGQYEFWPVVNAMENHTVDRPANNLYSIPFNFTRYVSSWLGMVPNAVTSAFSCTSPPQPPYDLEAVEMEEAVLRVKFYENQPAYHSFLNPNAKAFTPLNPNAKEFCPSSASQSCPKLGGDSAAVDSAEESTRNNIVRQSPAVDMGKINPEAESVLAHQLASGSSIQEDSSPNSETDCVGSGPIKSTCSERANCSMLGRGCSKTEVNTKEDLDHSLGPDTRYEIVDGHQDDKCTTPPLDPSVAMKLVCERQSTPWMNACPRSASSSLESDASSLWIHSDSDSDDSDEDDDVVERCRLPSTCSEDFILFEDNCPDMKGNSTTNEPRASNKLNSESCSDFLKNFLAGNDDDSDDSYEEGDWDGDATAGYDSVDGTDQAFDELGLQCRWFADVGDAGGRQVRTCAVVAGDSFPIQDPSRDDKAVSKLVREANEKWSLLYGTSDELMDPVRRTKPAVTFDEAVVTSVLYEDPDMSEDLKAARMDDGARRQADKIRYERILGPIFDRVHREKVWQKLHGPNTGPPPLSDTTNCQCEMPPNLTC